MIDSIDSKFQSGEPLEVDPELGWRSVAERLTSNVRDRVVLVGDGAQGWATGPLVAVEPSPLVRADRSRPGEVADALALIERRRTERLARGERAGSGIVMLASYDLLEAPGSDGGAPPSLIAWEVDRSIVFESPGRLRLTGIDASLRSRLLTSERSGESAERAFRLLDARSSLPREAYLRSVEKVRRAIARGEIYQANLCQMLEGMTDADPWDWFRAAERRTPALRSAFVSSEEFSLASLSPEIFVTVDAEGTIESWPIKGTRARHPDPELDRAAREALLASEKDRAELLMIVDLERNDLSRLCVPGTVTVPRLAECHSFPAVHHLVAQVRGRLSESLSVERLMRATFPGGSITGAPKLSAIEILQKLEPVPRGYFTGSLFWIGDDGRVDSSILIRSCVFHDGRARIGAGGGIVTDSDAALEWRESNDKARALTRLFGLEPEAFR